MSNFTNLNEIFHIFSKTPVADGQTLASARNKSGHTVTTRDVWAEDIPAFFSAPTQTYIDNNLKTIAKDNDLCYDETNKSILYFKNGNWVERGDLIDGELLANYEASKLDIYNDGSLEDESKAVVKYYKDRDAIAIDGINNNTADGNRYTARIAKDNNSFVQQFVSSMDKIVNGNPSSYYEPVVNGGDITEDIKDKGSTTKYIANNYSGIIQFHKQMVKTDGKLMEETSDGTLKPITISAFEYIGKTLTDVLKEFETVGSLEDVGISYKIYIPTKELPLPEPSIEYKNIILLVPEEPQGPDYMPPSAISGGYVEWLCVNKGTDEAPSWAWEQIGTTEADLKNYVKAIELNTKLLHVQENDNSNYIKLGSLVEDVAPYNSLAGSRAIENGVEQKYQNFNSSDIPNNGSIKVGISKFGEIAIGIETATDGVYGVSKMFTSAIPSTPATDDTTINEHKETAVSVKSASEMYNSLASAITSGTPSDEFDIPTFDLNYILQSKINEPWVEEMVIKSSDYALQIPYKDAHYTKYKNEVNRNFVYDKESIYFNSLNITKFYEVAEPITEAESTAGIKHRPIATIKKLANSDEYDLSTLYAFPDFNSTEFTNSNYKDLNEKEYENLQEKVKTALDSHLRSQLKIVEESFNRYVISVDNEESTQYIKYVNNSTDAIAAAILPFTMQMSNVVNLTETEWDKLYEIDENVKNFKIKITTPSSNISIDNITLETIDRPEITIQSYNKTLTIPQISLTLTEEAKGYLKDYIIEASSHYNLNSNDWQSFLSKVGREAAYKAKWIEDAKNDIIKTPLAFQYQRETTCDLFRLILINLLGGEEQYGKENSLSKKYMKPGITFTCLTRPYDRIGLSVSHYYSYTQNTWKGNPTGNYHPEVVTYRDGDIKWDYIPSLHTLNNTETQGTVDSFAHPTHWDTTTNEQKFDCLDDEIRRNKDDINDLKNRINVFKIPAAGDYLELNNDTYNVKYSDTITDDDTTVPTTKATMDFVNDQRIWDLNNFIYECLRKRKNDSSKYQWVEDYVLNSSNIYIDEEFETKNQWIEYVKAGNDPYNPLIFINDMYDVSTSNISESSSSYSKIGEFVKKMFLQLDEDAGKEWMSDDSFSKKYLKTGLSIKYITYLSIDGNNTDLPRPTDFNTIANLNSDYVYPSYTISIYTSPNFSDPVSFPKPVLDYNYVSYDSLTTNKNWNYLISEQEMKITRNFLKSLINDSTNELNAGKLIEVSEETISVKTSDEIINDADVTVDSKVLFDTLVNKEDYIKNTNEVIDVIEEIGDYNYNSITNTSSSSSGVYVGICYRPQKNAIVKSFQISEINLNEGRYLHVYKYNSGNLEYITVSNGTQTITDRNELFYGHASYDAKWQFDGFTVKENEEYHLFLKQDQTQNASNAESRIKVYPISNSEYLLSNSGHRDTSWKANFTVEGKEINISTTENIETENLTDYTIPTEFYGEFIRNKHDISYLYDKKNVISFNDGKLIIKDGDSNEIEYTKDLQKAVISRYTFRQPNSSTTDGGFRVDYVNDFTEFNKREFNLAAGAAGHGGSVYYHERDVFAPKYDNDLGDDGKPLMSTLQNVINGEGMFLRANLTTFNDDIRCLMNGKNMFAYNKKLTNFRSALPSLTLGDKMFLGAGIEIFNTKLPSLASAECMFRLCLNLKYVNTCIPNLCFAQGMFGYCLNLKHVDLSENSGMCLYNADDMFIGCPNLTHCKLNLSYLETGENMFSVGLYSASTDSSHEIQGHRITKGQSYGNPKLDIESIEYMANTIKDWSNPYTDSNLNINTTSHKITLGIDCSAANYSSSGYKEHIDKIKSHGWQVTLYDNTGAQINH